MKNEKAQNERLISSVALRALWLLADALMFGLAMYKTIEYVLMWMEGVTGALSMLTVSVAAAASIIGFRIVWARRFGEKFIHPEKNSADITITDKIVRGQQLKFVFSVLCELFFIVVLTLILARICLIKNDTQSFTWIPLEWHKYPQTLELLIRTSPVFAASIASLVLVGAILIEKRARWATMPVASAAFLLAWKQCSVISKEGSFILYFTIYLIPLFGLIISFATDRKRLAMRLLIYCAIPILLMWHYFGWMPHISDHSFISAPGVEKLYPSDGVKSEFPLSFLRDFKVDPDENYLYTAYGPTSGVIKLDLRSKILTLLDTTQETVRYIQLTSDPNQIYALDWLKHSLLTINSDPFRIARRESAFFKNGLYSPFYFLLKDDKMYATYTEQPGLAEFDLNPLKLRRKILFRDHGLTKFKSGVMLAALDSSSNRIFVELGMTDQRDKFIIARVNLNNFQVDGKAEMPEGGLELIAIPEYRKIIATSFYSNRIYEFDMDTMKLTRILRGPVSCRNLVYDSQRKLLIGTGFLNGELRFIDYATGRTLKTARIGNKAESLAIGAKGHWIFAGSSWGIFRVDIDKYLGETQR